MGTFSRAVNDQVRSVRRGPQTPSWWLLFQILAGVVLFVMVAWSVMKGTDAPVTAVRATPGTGPAPVASSTSSPGQSQDPADTSAPAVAYTQVASTDGGTVKVSTEAVKAAQAAYAATASPAAASEVPMAPGENFPAATKKLTAAKVGQLRASTVTSDRITFVATFDPDGPGPAPASYIPWTVKRVDGAWLVTLAG